MAPDSPQVSGKSCLVPSPSLVGGQFTLWITKDHNKHSALGISFCFSQHLRLGVLQGQNVPGTALKFLHRGSNMAERRERESSSLSSHRTLKRESSIIITLKWGGLLDFFPHPPPKPCDLHESFPLAILTSVISCLFHCPLQEAK